MHVCWMLSGPPRNQAWPPESSNVVGAPFECIEARLLPPTTETGLEREWVLSQVDGKSVV